MFVFDNKTIVPVRKNKPHIVFRAGYWRVSAVPKPKYGRHLWARAHAFIQGLNCP